MNGPILICDKSTIQGLGRSELNTLRKYYALNIPPVLIHEILADLKKHSDSTRSREEVKQLARKLVPSSLAISIDFRQLVLGETGGKGVTMDGRPVLPGGEHVLASDGKKGIIFRESPEAQALLRWQEGQFHQAEELLAEKWRVTSKAINLQELQMELKGLYSKFLTLDNLQATADFVDDLVASAPAANLTAWFMRDIGISTEDVSRALDWLSKHHKIPLRRLLPYTTHCIRAALIFHFALAFNLIGTRPTNRIDLEYLYYIPFCHAFSSGDIFHRQTARFALRANQTFIEREDLKAELKGLSGLVSLEDDEFSRPFPKDDSRSVTARLWRQVMKPRSQLPKMPSPLPSETQQKIIEQMNEYAKNSRKVNPPPDSADDLDFIIRKHQVRIDGPCFCGSSLPFRNCCGQKLFGK